MQCDVEETMTFAISSRPIEIGTIAVVLHLYSKGALVQKGMVTTCSRREAGSIVHHSRSYLLALGLRERNGLAKPDPIPAAPPSAAVSRGGAERGQPHACLVASINSSIAERSRQPGRHRRPGSPTSRAR